MFSCIVSYGTVANASPNPSSWKLISPTPNKVIKSGELFIAIKLLDSVTVNKGSLQILIDDNLITNFVKFSPYDITVLYTVPLHEGKHKIELHIRTLSNIILNPIISTFYVNKFSGVNKDSVIVKKADFFEFAGTLNASDKQMNYSGPGAEAITVSPNVPYVRDFDADLIVRVGKVSFPFKYYNTSDQYLYPPGTQSRNYLQYGIRYGGMEFLYGDQTPTFDKLVLSGIRVKGWMFTYNSPKFKIQVVNGISQFAQEGQLIKYHASDSISMPPPPNLRADSTYIVPGIYQRDLTAARISYGSPIEGSVISINLLRSRDEINSIHYGANAMDNIVAGADESFVTNANKMRVNAGFAVSALTTDTRDGPSTESQIDSLYGYKVGINPFFIKSIFVLNATTIKPNQPSTADYITAIFKSSSQDKQTNNLLTVDYHFFGSSYASFGNPFVLNDLWAGTLQDQIDFLNHKIVLSGRYTYQENNVSAGELTTLNTQIISGSALFAPSAKLPQQTILVNNQARNSPYTGISNLVDAHDDAFNITGLLNYNLKSGNSLTSFSTSYINSSRTDAINTYTSNKIQIASGEVSENLIKINLGLDLRYSTTFYSSPEMSTTSLSNSYDARIRYEIRKIKTTLAFGAEIVHSNALALLGSSYSDRNNFNFNINSRILRGFTITIEAGFAPYTDYQFSGNSYKENYAIARLIYTFDFKR